MRLSHNLFRSERFDEATLQIYFGGDGKGDTPVTIPNTEVKPFSADGTARVAVWESRTPPKYSYKKAPDGCSKTTGAFFRLNLTLNQKALRA